MFSKPNSDQATHVLENFSGSSLLLHKGQTDGTIRPYVVCTRLFNFISYHFPPFLFPSFPPLALIMESLLWSSSLLPHLTPTHPSGKHQILRGVIINLL